MRIGIIVAMDKELRQLQQFFCDDSVRVEKCGIGKVNAALGAQRMINEFKPDVIISSGCAGGNGDDVNIQDIVVSSELTYHDVYCGRAIDDDTVYGQVQGLPARYKADPELLKMACSLTPAPHNLSPTLPNGEGICSSPSGVLPLGKRGDGRGVLGGAIHPGLIVTGDWFVDSKEKAREIIDHFPEAKAIDMESCAIAQTCYINHVKFISFRVVSDIPLRDTDASQYHDFWDTVADHSFEVTKSFVSLIQNS